MKTCKYVVVCGNSRKDLVTPYTPVKPKESKSNLRGQNWGQDWLRGGKTG